MAMAQNKDSNTTQNVVGLTGGMGSGKSSVAVLLSESLAAGYIDMDRICRELLMPGAKGWRALQSTFGTKYFNKDQTVSRPLLRRDIFANTALRSQINGLVHPLAFEIMVRQVEHLLALSDRRLPVIVEVPLLFEAHWEKFFEKIVVVYATCVVCSSRLAKRDRITEAEARKALRLQWPLVDKIMKSDHVIDNSGCWAETCLQILHLRRLMASGSGESDSSRQGRKKT